MRSINRFLLSLAVVFFVIPVFAADETITISTYYPAPYGVYKEMRAQRLMIGENYINNAQHCWSPATCTNPVAATIDLAVQGDVKIVGQTTVAGNMTIGSSAAPQAALDIQSATSGVILPRLTADPTGINGMIYYNTQTRKFRMYENGAWKNMGGKVEMASGLYIGTGGSVSITTDFQPRVVMLLPHGEGSNPWDDNLILKMEIWPTSGALGTAPFGAYPGCGPCYWTAQYIKDAEGYDNPSCTAAACNVGVGYGITLQSNGFTTNVSENGRPYSWVAYGY